MGVWEAVKNQKLQISFLSAAGFAIVVALYEAVIIEHIGPRSRALKIAYLFEAIWEAGFFGFGLAFFIIYGYRNHFLTTIYL